ncbi:MAG: hypothetical protein ACLRXC_04615 [[Clostridium] leptum]
MLTGINLRLRAGFRQNLCDAVETACSAPGIQRVRLSLEPEQMVEGTIARLAQQPAAHSFIFVTERLRQHPRRMNRHYDTPNTVRLFSGRENFPMLPLLPTSWSVFR